MERCIAEINATHCRLCAFKYTGSDCSLEVADIDPGSGVLFVIYHICMLGSSMATFALSLVAMYFILARKKLKFTRILAWVPVMAFIYSGLEIWMNIDPGLYGIWSLFLYKIVNSISNLVYKLLIFSVLILWMDTVKNIKRKNTEGQVRCAKTILFIVGCVFTPLSISLTLVELLLPGSIFATMISPIFNSAVLLFLAVYSIVIQRNATSVLSGFTDRVVYQLRILCVLIILELAVSVINTIVISLGLADYITEIMLLVPEMFLETSVVTLVLMQVIQTARPKSTVSSSRSRSKTKTEAVV